tara:strand:- start:298 stop:1122 length:825 start_codon:yes stop_codon:yes gene_type:complete
MSIGSLKLKKFDPSQIKSNSVVMCIGKRGTGKTTLSADIMFYQRDKFDAGIAFSATEESNNFWSKHICDTLIHQDFDSKIYANFITEQRRINAIQEKPINSFALLEDCMYSKSLKCDQSIRGSFFNGRHWNIFLLVTMQYVLDLPPELRSNVDYVFVLRNNMVADREKIWRGFAGMVPTFALFNKIMNKCTTGYECMVINNTSRSNDIDDCLYWYCADIHDEFKVGKPQMWVYHYKMKKNICEEEEREDDDYIENLVGCNTYDKSKDISIKKLA